MGPYRLQLKSKIHRAVVTAADLHYIDSVTIDENLMEKADLWEGEKVLVVDNTNGERLETYVIKGARGSGTICMNGAASHKIKTSDEVIIMSFGVSDKPIKAKNILVDNRNRFVRFISKDELRRGKLEGD